MRQVVSEGGNKRAGRVPAPHRAGLLATALLALGGAALVATGEAGAQAVCAIDGGGNGGATASGSLSFACGPNAQAQSGIGGATAVGSSAQALGDRSTAIGMAAGQLLSGQENTLVGNSAGNQSTGDRISALGYGAGSFVVGSDNVAIGSDAGAGTFSTTLTFSRAIAIGSGSLAAFDDSIAIGTGVQATREFQVAIGSSDHTYTLAGIASGASAAAQTGPARFVSTDQDGNLAASAFTLQDVENTMTTVAGHTVQIADHEARITGNTAAIGTLNTTVASHGNQLTSLDGRVTALEGSFNALGSEIASVRTEARQGIAATIAMAAAPMPSAAGRTSWAMNVGHFKGETAVGGSLTHRFDTDIPLGLSVGYSYGGGSSHAARIGLTGEF